MSVPLHIPSHIPSHTQAFTSTLHHTSLFNLWLVILTAMFFFTILSWYNFLSSLYYYLSNNTSYLSGEDLSQHEKIEKLRNQMVGTLIFALIWTVITLLSYWLLSGLGWLEGDESSQKYWETHPLLRDEARLMK